MSLKEADWKTVLDKPKNVGLKAGGGTGISELLRKCAATEATFVKTPTKSAQDAAVAALKELETKCAAVISKNKAFTEACKHLDKVKMAATAHAAVLALSGKERRAIAALQESVAKIWNDMIQCSNKVQAQEYIERLKTALTAALNDELEVAFKHLNKLREIRPACDDIASGSDFRKSPINTLLNELTSDLRHR